jgi:hypothetical protein
MSAEPAGKSIGFSPRTVDFAEPVGSGESDRARGARQPLDIGMTVPFLAGSPQRSKRPAPFAKLIFVSPQVVRKRFENGQFSAIDSRRPPSA